MITRRYFYSGVRLSVDGGRSWCSGCADVVSWLPLSAGELLDLVERECREAIEEDSPGISWHDKNVRLVALNRI